MQNLTGSQCRVERTGRIWAPGLKFGQSCCIGWAWDCLTVLLWNLAQNYISFMTWNNLPPKIFVSSEKSITIIKGFSVLLWKAVNPFYVPCDCHACVLPLHDFSHPDIAVVRLVNSVSPSCLSVHSQSVSSSFYRKSFAPKGRENPALYSSGWRLFPFQ